MEIVSKERNIDEKFYVGTTAGALPGKALVMFDPRLGIAVDVFPCENGHAQERSL